MNALFGLFLTNLNEIDLVAVNDYHIEYYRLPMEDM